VAGNGLIDVGRQGLDMRTRQIGIHVVERERAFFLGQCDTGAIGGMADCRQPGADQSQAFGRAILHPAENQGIGQPRDTQADAALGARFLRLGLEGKA